MDQTVAAFAAQGIASVGVMQGYHPMTDAQQPVQVASIQTLAAPHAADRPTSSSSTRRIAGSASWASGWRCPNGQKVPFVGLSATPWTKGLGKHYDDLIVAATTSELIDKGFLSPFRVFAPAHPDLSGVKVVAGDYHEGQLSEAMSQPVLVADTVSTWLRLGEDRPTLCFAVDRAHARKLADEFEAAGVPTGYVDANTPADERERIGRRLREGQIKVVCNVFCLTTGVDWDVRCIILARPTKSEILYTQIIGRGLRTAEGKQDCLILDHSDTTLRLGFVTDIHHEHLDDGRHRKSNGVTREKPTPLPKECPSCSYLKPAGVHQLPGVRLRARAAVGDRGEGRQPGPAQRQAQGKRRHTAQPAGGLFDAAVGPAGARLQARLCRGEVQGPLSAIGRAGWPKFATAPACAVPQLAQVAADRLPQATAEGGAPCCMSLSRTALLGRWRGILAGAGCPAKALSNRHGPARCAAARTASASTTRAGGEPGSARKCGAGDGIELVKRIQNVEFKEAARLIEQHIGAAPVIVSANASRRPTRRSGRR